MRAPLAKTSKNLLASRRGRWTFAGLVVLALSLLFLGRLEHPLVDRLRAGAADAASPVLDFLARPLARLDAALEWAGGLTRLASENARLREETAELRRWRDAALTLERENERLRALLNAPKLELPVVVTPRVVGVAGGPFVRAVLVNAGYGHGVRPDQPVVDERGLVGRVLEPGRMSSRVLLITDLNSRVPVRVQRSGEVAIARGRNDALIELAFLPPDADVKPGDTLLTSGDGGIFPPDIPVGRIEMREDRTVLVRPSALLDRLEFVRVLAALEKALEIGGKEGDAP